MRVLVAGSHGQVGRHLVRLLSEAGHEARAMIRDDSQAGEMEALGGTPVVADLEGDPSPAAKGCDAIVFTAGGGPGSGAAKKETVDRQGAVKLIDAAGEHGVRRYVMVSAMGADDPESGSEGMRPYLRAKGQADDALRESGLDFTIVRPGRLTDDPATGRVDAAASLGRRGEITREDTARVLLATLTATNTHGKTFEVLDGDTPIDEAVNAL
ncbi:NAD(P)H-binding protein [Rubrobacter marinus]|uniref:NAD(P)H-binding protein n=1 Tax=Rubrobacter marinus TaxID=2653852 RepID=A0A6G8PYI3_9ACTN|nr:SDR family oxidoreductase [Rubrobacter marinus]QIN79271.1 NAD(P)H-binding protein [Rubrobacter marinus]